MNYKPTTFDDLKQKSLYYSRKKHGLHLSYRREKPFSSILKPHFTLNETFTGFASGMNIDTGRILHLYAHHDTVIAIIEIDPIKILINLNNGGYYSVTTKKRLNTILAIYDFDNRIYQHDHTWYISKGGNNLNEDSEYHNFMTIEQSTSLDQLIRFFT